MNKHRYASATITQADVKSHPASSNTSVVNVTHQIIQISNATLSLVPLFVPNQASHESLSVHSHEHRDSNLDYVKLVNNSISNVESFGLVNNTVHSRKGHSSTIDVFFPLPDTINTPINIENFERCLRTHPDQSSVTYLVNGLRHGFDIGYRNPHVAMAPPNLLSATQHEHAVTAAIRKEVDLGHLAGPFQESPLPNLHRSPLGSREKKDGSRRLIMDLSQPRGSSINEGIDKEDFSVKYTHFDEATTMVRNTGPNCLLTKIDIKHASRLLPVLPAQWILLGMCWLSQIFIDTRLPFGLRSSPAIFNRFADAVCWIFNFILRIPNLMHYSDDFLLVSPPDIDVATKEKDSVLAGFAFLGIPIALDKLLGPLTILTFLGIDIDSTTMTMKIPDEKLDELGTLLPKWLNRKKCIKRELLSLIGKLSFVCRVVRPGRPFLRRLITLSTKAKQNNHHIDITSEARKDIQWWLTNLPLLNRLSIIPDSSTITSDDIQLHTDASGLGFGATYGNSWIQEHWPPNLTTPSVSVDFQELFAIHAACQTWGHNWPGKRIIYFTDNKPITQIWDAGTTQSEDLMKLIRAIYSTALRFQFTILLKHIYGTYNSAADALSRFQEERFRSAMPHADVERTQLNPAAWLI